MTGLDSTTRKAEHGKRTPSQLSCFELAEFNMNPSWSHVAYGRRYRLIERTTFAPFNENEPRQHMTGC